MVDRLRRYRWLGGVSLLAGFALLALLVARIGIGVILADLRVFGANFLVLVLISGVRQFLRTLAWQNSIEEEHRNIRLWELLQIRLAADTLSGLTFAGVFLGETAKTLVVSRKMPMAHGLSSILIENFLYSLSIFLFILSGIVILVINFAVSEQLRMASQLAAVVLLFPFLVFFLIARQKWRVLGMLLDTFKRRGYRWPILLKREEKLRLLEENTLAFYSRSRGRFFLILILEILACLMGVIEAYLILSRTTSHPSWSAAFVIESVYRIVNVVFAFIPLRLGVDEGGAGLTLQSLGYTLADGLSLAVIRKIRVLAWTVIGLLVIGRLTLAEKNQPEDSNKFLQPSS
jgi:uncharacterized membrane protein YbhN (UPF0104 family)